MGCRYPTTWQGNRIAASVTAVGMVCIIPVYTWTGRWPYSFMMTSSNGNIFRVTGEFPTQRPMARSFGVFFDLRLNKRLSKQWLGWWFETPSCPLWRHCNVNCRRNGSECSCWQNKVTAWSENKYRISAGRKKWLVHQNKHGYVFIICYHRSYKNITKIFEIWYQFESNSTVSINIGLHQYRVNRLRGIEIE